MMISISQDVDIFAWSHLSWFISAVYLFSLWMWRIDCTQLFFMKYMLVCHKHTYGFMWKNNTRRHAHTQTYDIRYRAVLTNLFQYYSNLKYFYQPYKVCIYEKYLYVLNNTFFISTHNVSIIVFIIH